MAVKREQAKEYLALMLSQSKAHESDNALVAFRSRSGCQIEAR